ncbi:MAG: hypothetical protein PW734_07215 [Verrucomicrobium sp.]|nr:hypothetical protein [Verrucomicrobium sp.]
MADINKIPREPRLLKNIALVALGASITAGIVYRDRVEKAAGDLAHQPQATEPVSRTDVRQAPDRPSKGQSKSSQKKSPAYVAEESAPSPVPTQSASAPLPASAPAPQAAPVQSPTPQQPVANAAQAAPDQTAQQAPQQPAAQQQQPAQVGSNATTVVVAPARRTYSVVIDLFPGPVCSYDPYFYMPCGPGVIFYPRGPYYHPSYDHNRYGNRGWHPSPPRHYDPPQRGDFHPPTVHPGGGGRGDFGGSRGGFGGGRGGGGGGGGHHR